MAIHKAKPKKGPQVAVPGAKKTTAPRTGRSSFAVRVKSRRRQTQKAAGTPAAASASQARPRKAAPAGRSRAPQLRTREERVAIARGKASPAPSTSDAKPTAPTRGVRGAARQPAANAAGAQASRPQRDPDPGFVAVGRVLGPFGLKGELRVQSLTENPARWRSGSRLYAGMAPVTVASSREAQGYVYVRLKGFPDRTSVERFRNAMLQVPESDLPQLAEGEFYRFQLVGLQVVHRDGTPIGVVEEVLETGATDVYRVARPDAPDLLLAAIPDVVLAIDLDAGTMTVDPPDWR